MSNSAWYDLNSKGNILKLHDKCHNLKRNCQKIITVTPNQYMLEGNGYKNTMIKLFEGSQTAWNKFLRPALKTASPYIGMAVGANTKNPKVGKATSNIRKSNNGGKILSLTDMHGRRLRLKVM